MHRVAAAWIGVALVALGIWTWTSQARAQQAGFSRCAVVQTASFNNVENVDESKVPVIPAGWTPIGGGPVAASPKPAGYVVICK
jgi:hypothetical protein